MSEIGLLNSAHKKVTIMGLGLFGGGVGAARFFAKLGSHVTVTDLRDAAVLQPSLDALRDLPIRFVLGRHEIADFTQTDLLIVNQAVPPDNQFVNYARTAGVALQTETGLALKMLRGKILAVTGSNGKSTTTSLLGAMLKAANPHTLIGGNLGGSLLDALPTHLPSAPVVLELSSFQLHYLQNENFAPTVAVVTNLSPNHLDWHKTTLHYYASKRHLVNRQNATDFAILNYDDLTLREWAKTTPAITVMTALNEPPTANAGFKRGAEIICRLDGVENVIGDFAEFKLFGEHNKINCVQAAVAAYVFNRQVAAINAGIAAFGGLPHRLETVGARGGKIFINDSIATTPESTICGLNAFTAPVVLIAGGYDKGSEWSELARAIVKKTVGVVLIGKTAAAIREAILALNPQHQIIMAGTDFAAAVVAAEKICPVMPKGESSIVLLSPACASYDLFKNFAERGEQFKKLVNG